MNFRESPLIDQMKNKKKTKKNEQPKEKRSLPTSVTRFINSNSVRKNYSQNKKKK